MTDLWGTAEADVLDVLGCGTLELTGRLVEASNATFLGRMSHQGAGVDCVYKPVRGERPLWDFPHGTLAGREVAAYLVSEAADWGVVPPTTLADGPFGPGMVQAWVEVTTGDALVDVVPRGRLSPGWLRVLDAYDGADRPVSLVHANRSDLRQMALFDVVINNADRKGGHLLPDSGGHARGCDHGVCFHVEPKLRTVLWGWADEPLTDPERTRLERTRDALNRAGLQRRLGELISAEEQQALRARIAELLAGGVFPGPGDRWPSIPWPPL